MRSHDDLLDMNERSLAQQAAVRKATFSPGEIKELRPFSIWEISQFMFDVPADTLRKKLAEDPSLPQGETEEDGRQRWFTLSEINELRRRIRFRGGVCFSRGIDPEKQHHEIKRDPGCFFHAERLKDVVIGLVNASALQPRLHDDTDVPHTVDASC